MSEHISVYPGTPLKERDFAEAKVLCEWWVPRAEYAWDAGVAIGRFLRELRAGRLIARRCPQCRRVLVPPRMVCEHCFCPTSDWVYLPGTGAVKTFSICYVTWDMQPLEEPIIPAVIALDGASPGGGIMHLLGEVSPEAVRIGLRVEPVFRPAGERTGAITDIRYFRPIAEVNP